MLTLACCELSGSIFHDPVGFHVYAPSREKLQEECLRRAGLQIRILNVY